jgi:hypothetical protein
MVKSFTGRVWFFFVLSPVAFRLDGMKVPSIFGIEISVDPELNLCLSITTGSIPFVVTVTSSLVGCCIRYVFHLSEFEFASGLI